MIVRHIPYRKYEPYLFYDYESGWYFKVLIITNLWMFGPDVNYQPDQLWFSLGPIHLSIAQQKLRP